MIKKMSVRKKTIEKVVKLAIEIKKRYSEEIFSVNECCVRIGLSMSIPGVM